MAFMVWSVFQIFLPPGPVQNTIFSLLGSILFSAYIVYDTDNLIQRKLAVLSANKWASDLIDRTASAAVPACHLYAGNMYLLGCLLVC